MIRTHAWRVMVGAAFVMLLGLAYAGTWRDDFENPELPGWTLLGLESDWRVEDGFLKVTMLRQLDCLNFPFWDMLEFTASKGPYDRLSVVAQNMNGALTIGLGKHFPKVQGIPDFFYQFHTRYISAGRFNGRGGVAAPDPLIPRHPVTHWDTPKQLDEIRVVFDQGNFQVVANGEFRTEFTDPEMDHIDRIGLLFTCNPEGQLGSFQVSSPSIEEDELLVTPQQNLVTQWARLKR